LQLRQCWPAGLFQRLFADSLRSATGCAARPRFRIAFSPITLLGVWLFQTLCSPCRSRHPLHTPCTGPGMATPPVTDNTSSPSVR
jgi:hypothetical protein